MSSRIKLNARVLFLFAVFAAGIIFSTGLAGCSSPKPAEQKAPQRYPLSGQVISVDKAKQQVVVDAAEIPGYMMAMTMGYDVKPLSLLDTVSPGDQITADVVVNGNDVWLENIVMVKKAGQANAPSSKDSHPVSAPPGKQ